MPKSTYFLSCCVSFCLLFFGANVFAQVNAVSASHGIATDDTEKQIEVTLSGNLTANYFCSSCAPDWTVTVGGSSVAITSVVGANGSNKVTITLAAAIGIGQAVKVSYGGSAQINSFTNLVSTNDWIPKCSDFTFQGVYDFSQPCAPVNPDTKMIFLVSPRARNSSKWNMSNVKGRIHWKVNNASPESFIPAYESNIAGDAASGTNFITINSIGASDPTNYIYPGNENVCGYTSYWHVRIDFAAITSCPITNPTQQVTYASHNTDALGEGDGQLLMPPLIANSNKVCEGQYVDMKFNDNSDLNCIDNAAAPPPLPKNQDTRWVRVIYGWPDMGAANTIPNVVINGVPITDASGNLLVAGGYYPIGSALGGTTDGFGVVQVNSLVTGPRGALERIQTSTPTPVGSLGKRFYVTLQYFNVCNAYATGNFTNVRQITNYVEVIDAPDAPIVPNKEICFSESTTLTVSSPIAGGTYRWYSSLADANAGTNVIATGTSYTPTLSTAVTSFWVTASNNATPVSCTSPPTQVTITRRPDISTAPPVITGSTDICPNAAATYSLPVDPATETPGGATEYLWTVPVGWTITSGQGTKQITVTAGATTGARTLQVVRRYVTATTSGSRCDSSPRTLSITVHANPTASPTTPVNICEGTVQALDGNPSGTIASHLWTGNTTILSATNIQKPNTLAGASPGTYNLTYTATDNFGCSGSAAVVVNVSASPTPADTGPDQPLCQVTLQSNPLGGSNPAPGTGTWTIASKPAASTATNANFVSQTTANTTFNGDVNGQFVLRWTVVNGNCTTAADILVDFGTDPGPQNAGADNKFCGTTGSLSASTPAVGTGTWTQVAGPIANNTTFSNPNSPTPTITLANTTAAAFGNYTYRWTVVSGTCTPRTDDVIITFSRPPVAIQPADFTTCIDPAAITPISISGTVQDGAGAAQQGRWMRPAATGGLFANGANPGATFTGPTIADQYTPTAAEVAVGTIVLKLTALDPDGGGPCSDVNSGPLTITIDKKPLAAEAGTANPVCKGDIVSLAATAVSPNGIGTWSPAAGVSNVNDPNATVTGVTANTSFTWTVKSILGSLGSPPTGACPATTDNVMVVIRPLPDAVDSHPNTLCETNAGTFISIGEILANYNSGVINGAPAAQRTVTWYATLNDQTLNINPITIKDISNGQVLFTRVVDTSTPQNCYSLGQVTFTVNAKPTAIDVPNKAFCEQGPPGSNRVDDIDLMEPSLINTITNSTAGLTITWHKTKADANAGANAIATPGDVDIVGDSTVFARVVNGIGCFNVAQVNLIVKPKPADRPILGSSTPCTGTQELYRVAPISGATYVWTIPSSFVVMDGGQPTNSFVLIDFQSPVDDVLKVKMIVNGCEGNEYTKSVKATDGPTGFAITQVDPPPICENGTYHFKVSPDNTGSSTYNWQVFKQSNSQLGGGVIANGQTTGDVLINVESEDVFIEVTETTQSGCNGTSPRLFLSVNKKPSMADGATSICSGDALGIVLKEDASSSVAATTFKVSVPSILPGIIPASGPTTGVVAPNGIASDAYKNQTIAPVLQLIYRVQPISAAGCLGDEKSITVNVKAEPLLDANLGRTICSREQTGVIFKPALNSFPANKYIIDGMSFDNTRLTPLTALPPIGTLVDGNRIFSDTWSNVTGDTASVIYYVRPFSTVNGCYGNPPIPVKVIVRPDPMITPIANPPAICSGDVLNIPITSSNIPGAQIVWTVAYLGSNISGATGNTTNTINDQLFNTGQTLDFVRYEIHGSAATCIGPAVFVKVDVKPSPTVQNLAVTECSDTKGGNTYVENLSTLESRVSSDPGVTNFTWFTNSADFTNSQIPGPQVVAYTMTDNVPVFVRVENGSSACSKDAEVRYTINPTPQITATPTVTLDPAYNISCNGNQDGQINVSAQYGTGHTFSKNGVSYVPTVAFSKLGQGTYIIRTKNAEGCKDSVSVTLVEPAAISFTTTTKPTACFNDPSPSGEVRVNATGGAGALTFILLQDQSNKTGETTGDFTGLRAGSYKVSMSDANGCSKLTPTMTVNQPTEIKINIDITSDDLYNGYDVSCTGVSDGQISVLNTTGGTPGTTGYTYLLDQDPANTSGLTSGVFDNLSANVLYTITVTDSAGCQKTSLPEFLVDPIPLFAGVVGFDSDVCEGGDPVAFKVLAKPFGGIGNYTYQWEASTDNVNFTLVSTDEAYDPGVLTDTTYYRRKVISSLTCPAAVSDTVVITTHPLPEASIDAPDFVCEGSFFVLNFKFTKGSAPYYFDYSNGTTTTSLVGGDERPVPISNFVTPTTYTVTSARDFYGCKPVVLPSKLVDIQRVNTDFSIAGQAAQCSGSQFTFDWQVLQDVEYTWVWEDGRPDSVIAANTVAPGNYSVMHTFQSFNPKGDTKYPVYLKAVNNANGLSCFKQSQPKNVTVYPAIFANAYNDKTEICSGETVKFTNLTQGGTTHNWYYREVGTTAVLGSKGPFTAPTSQEFTFVNNTTKNPIIYEIVYEVNNANCSGQIIMRDTVYRGMDAAFDVTSVSKYIGGNAFATFTNNSTPNDPDIEYQWEFGNGALPLNQMGYAPPASVKYTSIGDKQVRLTATNIIARNNDLSCFDVDTKTVTILLPDLVADFLYSPQDACFPADIAVTKNLATGDIYDWVLRKNGEKMTSSNDSLPTFKIVNPGDYIIELTTTNSITGQTAFHANTATPIHIYDVPFASFETRPEIVFVPDDQGMQTFNGSSRATKFYWDFDDGDTSTEFEPKHFYQLEGRYDIMLIASDTHGTLVCSDTATHTVIAKQGGLVKIPNAFTPNSDGPTGGTPSVNGRNDVFLPVMKGVEEFHMQIFDRWGTLVFESKERNHGWDGYDKNGVLLPSGVYVYKLTMRLSNNQRTTQVGDVTLIR